MARLPQRYSPLAYGIIQAAITTGVATAIATYQLRGIGADFLSRWCVSWLVAWLTMLPVVVLIAPFVQRAVAAMTAPDRTSTAP